MEGRDYCACEHAPWPAGQFVAIVKRHRAWKRGEQTEEEGRNRISCMFFQRFQPSFLCGMMGPNLVSGGGGGIGGDIIRKGGQQSVATSR